MKTNIKNALLMGMTVFGLVSCSENSWNDQLDGFVGGPDFSNVQTLDYTLTDADYEAIAANSSNKEKAKEEGYADELTAVGKLHYLNGQIDPAGYIPNFLKDPKFQYFTLGEGSAINVTYKVAKDLPEDMIGMNAAAEYLVTTKDYQEAYGSDVNYVDTFSPLATASSKLPGILKAVFGGAEAGDYVVVGYNNTDTTPVFEPLEEDNFEMSDVLKNLTLNETINVKGVVTAVCAQGFILTDNAGSILVYFGSSYDQSYTIGDELEVSGAVTSYNMGFQLPSSSTITRVGHTKNVKYPDPKVYTGPDMDTAIQTTANATAVYCSVTGKVTISGNYYNLIVPGAETAQGSFYQLTAAQKAQLKDGAEVTITGYFTSVSKSGGAPKFFNFIMTGVRPANAVDAGPGANTTALYLYNGTSWAQVADVDVLQPINYEQMGVLGNELTAEQAQRVLPIYLANKYPYATAGTKKAVLYGCNGSYSTVQYEYEDGQWIDTISAEGVISETNQFVYKAGGWVMDPSIELTLPVGKNKPTSTWFYQAVVDWVRANVANGDSYIDSYGTAEYYSGCSSYQGNLNINGAYGAVTEQATAAGMSVDEYVATMMTRFKDETAPGALSVLYPNMAPIGDYEPTVTITFTAWTTGGVNKEYTIVFKCVAKGSFEFVSCTWDE